MHYMCRVLILSVLIIIRIAPTYFLVGLHNIVNYLLMVIHVYMVLLLDMLSTNDHLLLYLIPLIEFQIVIGSINLSK